MAVSFNYERRGINSTYRSKKMKKKIDFKTYLVFFLILSIIIIFFLGLRGNQSYDTKNILGKEISDFQLKEFHSAGKIKLRDYLDNINAVEIKLNGRINPETILLKAVR